MPLKKRQTAKTFRPKRLLKDPSKIPSGLTNTSSPSIESNQQNSNVIENFLPNEEKMYIPYLINEIVDMKFVFGEQYAKVSFEDQTLEPQWEPVKNIRCAEGLILKFQRKKEEEEREKHVKELQDSQDKMVSVQQNSTSYSFTSVTSVTSVTSQPNTVNDSKLKSVKFANQDSQDKTVSVQQNSTSYSFTSVTPVTYQPITVNDSKLKSVKFAQELVNTKIFSSNDNLPTSMIKTSIKATPKPILKSALRISDKQTKINDNFWQWNGILLKGTMREFAAKVIVKALKEGQNYKTISDRLSHINAICMANTVPLSYALFLIDKYREEPDDVLIMECESGNLKEEQDHMKLHELVAFIRLENDYNGLYFFVFADYRWINKNLHLDQEPLLLVAKNVKIRQKYLLVQQPSVRMLDNETNFDANYYKAKTELFTSGYNDIVTKLCEQRPNFTVYARPKFGETDSIITIMKVLGANYFPNYDCDNMDLVLVHVLMLDQINFMPNLIELRRQEQCKFFVYGCDFERQEPIKFEECFVSGGILSVTIRALLEEENGLQRVLAVIEYQKENGANWKFLMDPEIKHNNYNLDALINPINPHLRSDEGVCMINFNEIDYFDIILWRKLKKPNDTNISILYYSLLFSYFDIKKPPRHCILIARNEEMSFRPKVPGVDVITLKTFEDIFGFDDTMEWE